ncbi:hypothetical protein I352_03610 [Cryptococcus deuterogattii MMRL2647]|nr:hypothetical protein I352_03610 [Cryptococcus deuterogattii MMRL2647]
MNFLFLSGSSRKPSAAWLSHSPILLVCCVSIYKRQTRPGIVMSPSYLNIRDTVAAENLCTAKLLVFWATDTLRVRLPDSSKHSTSTLLLPIRTAKSEETMDISSLVQGMLTSLSRRS